MRKIYILLLACPLLSLFVACNDNDYKASVTELRLVLVKPTNVYSGEIATILGRNFSTVPEENAVFINDQQYYLKWLRENIPSASNPPRVN